MLDFGATQRMGSSQYVRHIGWVFSGRVVKAVRLWGRIRVKYGHEFGPWIPCQNFNTFFGGCAAVLQRLKARHVTHEELCSRFQQLEESVIYALFFYPTSLCSWEKEG